jgi:murein L,D-transpeptidase YafK
VRSIVMRIGVALALAVALAGCGQTDGGVMSPSLKPLTKSIVELMAAKGMSPSSPIFIRVFKEESELEIWKARDDGHFYHLKTYPICNWSGDLGPKLVQGDRQAPEGFYTVSASQMNPNSNYYLSFNVGFPNAYDRSYGRTGQSVMVHGDCRSAGCYAMTDALIEEIYGVAREAFSGGQREIQLHAYPFRMTDENMRRHQGNQWSPFWRVLKQGYDYFEVSRQPPNVAVCNRQYIVSAKFASGSAIDPQAPCPPFIRVRPQLWAEVDQPGADALALRIKAPGAKTRNLDKERMLADQYSRPSTPADGGVSVAAVPEPVPVGASGFGFTDQ